MTTRGSGRRPTCPGSSPRPTSAAPGRRHRLPARAPALLRGPVVDPRQAGGRVSRRQRPPACRRDAASGGALPARRHRSAGRRSLRRSSSRSPRSTSRPSRASSEEERSSAPSSLSSTSTCAARPRLRLGSSADGWLSLGGGAAATPSRPDQGERGPRRRRWRFSSSSSSRRGDCGGGLAAPSSAASRSCWARPRSSPASFSCGGGSWGASSRRPGTGIFEVENAPGSAPRSPRPQCLPDPASVTSARIVFPAASLGGRVGLVYRSRRAGSPLAIGAALLLAGIAVAALRRALFALARGFRVPLFLRGVPAGVEPPLPDRDDLRGAARVPAVRRALSSSAAGRSSPGREACRRSRPGGGGSCSPRPSCSSPPARSCAIRSGGPTRRLFLNSSELRPTARRPSTTSPMSGRTTPVFAGPRARTTRRREIYEDYWDAWAGKGRVEKELGLLAEAEDSYESAIEANADL